jgi:hypothetical protein
VAYPLTVSERHSDQQLARKTLHGGIIKCAFTGKCWLTSQLLFLCAGTPNRSRSSGCCHAEDELNTLYNDRLTNIIGKMLLMASPDSEDASIRPFYSVSAIVQSVHKLLEGCTKQAIWAEVRHLTFTLESDLNAYRSMVPLAPCKQNTCLHACKSLPCRLRIADSTDISTSVVC